jgi:hypothetical protein
MFTRVFSLRLFSGQTNNVMGDNVVQRFRGQENSAACDQLGRSTCFTGAD